MSTNIKLVSILAIALGTRLFAAAYVAPHSDRYINSDAVGYDQLARNLVAGNGFSMRATPPYVPDNFRTPGYPAILAFVYGLFGYRPDYVLYLQAFAGMLACLVAFAMGAIAGDKTAGLVAAGLVAINPHSITYAALLWSDVIYALLVALATLLMMLMLAEHRIEFILLAGFTLGIATLVHPRSLALVLVPTYFLVTSPYKSNSLRNRLVQAAAYIAAFMFPLAPWLMRNHATFGVLNLSSAAGTNMLFYGAALTESRRTGEDQWIIANRLESEILDQSAEPLNEAEFADLALERGIELILDDPGSYATVQLIGTAKVFLPGTLSTRSLFAGINSNNGGSIYELLISRGLRQDAIIRFLRSTPAPVLIIAATDCALLVVMLSSWLFTIIWPSRSRFRFGALLSLVVLYFAFVAGPAGAPRFRVAFIPLLAVLSAPGIQAQMRSGGALLRQARLLATHLARKPI